MLHLFQRPLSLVVYFNIFRNSQRLLAVEILLYLVVWKYIFQMFELFDTTQKKDI